jgi:Raf kinase inhibitor-like YbhB/YbcL family protein
MVNASDLMSVRRAGKNLSIVPRAGVREWRKFRAIPLCLSVIGLIAALASEVCPQSPDRGSSKRKKAPIGFQITSDAFANGRLMPATYTCDGDDVSPPLVWTGAPSGVKSFAVICDDTDAQHVFVHWVIFNIPGTALGLPTRVPPDITLEDGAKQCRNGFNGIGYGGPCPPGGNPHRYFFHVYAIDKMLDPTITSRDDLEKAMKGHILAEGALIGVY